MSHDTPSSDALVPFVVEHAAMRGAFVRLPATLRAVLACHPYPLAVARVLGELCAATALLASTLKFKGSIAAQLSGDGPVRLLVVECTATLGLRATAQWDAARVAALPRDATLAQLAGGTDHGRLVLTLDPKDGGALYQGIVALEGGSVAGVMEHYLATSEQLASKLVLATGERGAAGFLLQRLPGSDDDATWTATSGQLAGLEPAALLAAGAATDILARTLPEHEMRVFAARAVTFQCACSRERVANALRIAGSAEVESILAEKGFVDVTCEFCNRSYVFTPVEARGVFAPREGH